MKPGSRRARLKALAKINLSLKVLHKRADGFHELRTIFQTISLGDTLELEFVPSGDTRIEVDSDVQIANNLVARAAAAVLDAGQATGEVTLRLRKEIPVGGGMGGGSSDAAAVLLALPVLAGREVPLERLVELGAGLGSDVPFFLMGGSALGIGRGTELYPVPDAPPLSGVAIFPTIGVSTTEAYRALQRELTQGCELFNMSKFQVLSWSLARGLTHEAWATLAENDFEEYVWERYPELATIRRKLAGCGAKPVMLSGSGSSLFGIFSDRTGVERALGAFAGVKTAAFRLVSRSRYQRMWWRSLREHMKGESWPPRSRYL
jgi:4-diphosphocytidyl-2-C-methyl-D-erythritol kinase